MKYHFIGISGAGMSAVAKLLVDNGDTVTGSDEGFYPPISDYLVEHKIPCTTPFSPNNIPEDADYIVIGKHAKLIPEENEEVKAALSSGKTILSFPQV
ncbi:MAG: Mur ligase domain-containing protein, partial [Candidatus Paceibacterota bacterium]